MRKIILLIVLFLFPFSFTPIFADELSFRESAHVTYELQNDNSVKATYEFQITNLKTEVYAPNIKISLEGFNPSRVEAFEAGVQANIKSNENNTYQVTFKKPALGKGANKKLVFTFYDSSIVEASDQMVRIHIPEIKNIDRFQIYEVDLKVPTAVATHPTITPKPIKESSKSGYSIYSFNKNNLPNPINADFGEYQDYSFSINYLPESFEFVNGMYSVPLPADNNYQKVAIGSISNKPTNIVLDFDGNWIALFDKRPEKTLLVKGSARLFENPLSEGTDLSDKEKSIYLNAQKYWEVNDQYIKQFAEKLKTPKDIYNFVVSTLSYNFGKTNRGTSRMGAVESIKNPKEAICMEFTDLFITLSRAAGIPAREINGYAYTTNTSVQPLSLVSDILHSWPEYWDKEKKTWISVDPTWGNTTHGVDYFNKFDTNHFALITKGISSTSPITPGTITSSQGASRLIEVEQKPGFSEEKSKKLKLRFIGIPFINEKLEIEIQNTGNVSIRPGDILLNSTSGKSEKIKTTLIPPQGKVSYFSKIYEGQVIFMGEVIKLEAPKTRPVFYLFLILLFVGSITGVIVMIKYAYEHNKLSKRG